MLLGAVEGLGQPTGETLAVLRGRPRAEDVDEPPREQRADDLPKFVLSGALAIPPMGNGELPLLDAVVHQYRLRN